MQAMNFGSVLPDVKANLPLPGQTLSNGSNVIQRACVPGIEAHCTTVPFTSIMVGRLSLRSIYFLLSLQSRASNT